MRASREQREDPLLEWKVRILSVAIALALAGMYFGERWMTGAALALLVGAAVLRMTEDRKRRPLYEADDASDDDGPLAQGGDDDAADGTTPPGAPGPD